MMIVRTRRGISNVPAIDIILLLAFGIFTGIQKIWLHADVEWRSQGMMIIIAVILVVHFLLCVRWCTLKNGCITCRTLFQKFEIKQASAKIEFEKDWLCTVTQILLFWTGGWYSLVEPRWIVLSGSDRRFTLKLSAYAREREQSLKDVTDALAVKTHNVDMAHIQSAAAFYRRWDYMTYALILILAACAVVYLYFESS